MPLTLVQVALADILLDRIITASTALKKVPSMTEEEVDIETLKWEKKSDEEMDELEGH